MNHALGGPRLCAKHQPQRSHQPTRAGAILTPFGFESAAAGLGYKAAVRARKHEARQDEWMAWMDGSYT